MNIQWGWNLHSCHNCHRPSFCRLLLSRFNGTIKQKVGGRSRKLFWTASILGACWPGKTSGKCHQLAISGIWECSLTATIAQYAGQIKRMHHVCSEIGCESDLVCGLTVLQQEIFHHWIFIRALKMFQGHLKPSCLQFVTVTAQITADGHVSFPSHFYAGPIHVYSFQLKCTDCAVNHSFTQGLEYFQLSWPEIHYNRASLQ